MVSRTNISKAFLAMLLVAVVAMAGCKPGQGYAISEEDEPNYRKGESLMRENRMDEALLAFEKVVDARRDSPESHLELGRIYMDHVKDPISAIYHFRKYLELRPQSEFSRQVAQLIESCKKDFARSLPGDPFAESVERSNVLDQMKNVRLENDELRRTVASLQNQLRTARPVVEEAPPPPPAAVSAAPAQQAQPQAATSTRTYTVRTGDTLSKISTAVYGSPSRWQDIYNANRNQLRNPHDLKVGMVLSIPR
jgi:LysM repeat protein